MNPSPASQSPLQASPAAPVNSVIGNLPLVFVLVGLLAGTLLVFLTPPFQVPDEPAHFYRAYQISEGTLVARSPDGICGGNLPASLKTVADPFMYLCFHMDRKTSRAAILAQLNVPLQPDHRVFIPFANVIYSPVPYIASAPAIALGRRLGLTPLRLMYAGRLANLLVFVLLGFMALKIVPAFRPPLLLLLVMPMMLFLAGSLSADVVTDSLAMLLASLIFRQGLRAATHPAETIGWGAIAAIATASVGLTLAKSAYFPLAGLVLLIPAARCGGRWRYAFLIAVLLTLNLLAQLLWSSQTPGLDARINPPADPHRQLALVLHHPFYFGQVVGNSLVRDLWMLVRSFVGWLGWMEPSVPIPFILLYLVAMGLACQPSPGDPTAPRLAKPTAVVLLCAGAAMLLVAVLNYLFWDSVGMRHIDGTQGRYFFPVAPAIILLAAWGWFPKLHHGRAIWSSPRHNDALAAGMAVLSALVTVTVVFARYYV